MLLIGWERRIPISEVPDEHRSAVTQFAAPWFIGKDTESTCTMTV